MNNIIIFPPIKKEEIIYSQKLNNFFYKNNINPLIDDFFEIQKLINLYDANLNEYYRIKIELELKGFNFCGDEKFQFIQKIEWEKTEYIFNIKNKAFSKKQLKKLGILELVNQIGVKDYNYFNFIPFERLLYLADYRNDIKRSLKKLDFTIITFSSINKEESIDVTDLNGENNVGNNNSEKIDDKAYKIKHDISSMYGVFAKKILFFGFEYTIKQTSSFFSEEVEESLESNIRLIDYFTIFKNINIEHINYENELPKLINLLNKNKNLYISEITNYNLYIKLFKRIRKISRFNDNLFIYNLYNGELFERI